MSKEGKTKVFILLLLTILGIAIFQDFLQSRYQSSSFYLSESLVFSILWLFFLPITFFLRRLFKKIQDRPKSKLKFRIGFVLAAVLLHVVIYSLMVNVISSIFLDHTFGFWRNLVYTLSADLYKYVFIYSAISLIPIYPKEDSKIKNSTPITPDSLWINTGRKTEKILQESIFYIQSSSPYVEIFTSEKKYLHSATLKSMSQSLDQNKFVRIHKSTLVNLEKVRQLHSRLNGDYDLVLSNGHVLRLSRNYVSEFRSKQQTSTSAQGI